MVRTSSSREASFLFMRPSWSSIGGDGSVDRWEGALLRQLDVQAGSRRHAGTLLVTQKDEWLRFVPAWHTGMVILGGATAALLLVDSGLSTVARRVALSLVACIVAWYGLVGRRAVAHLDEWSGPAYVLVAAPLSVALFAVAPAGSLMLFALYPHIW